MGKAEEGKQAGSSDETASEETAGEDATRNDDSWFEECAVEPNRNRRRALSELKQEA